MTKNGATTAAFAGVNAFYQPAFVDIEDVSGGIVPYPSGEWNNEITAIRLGWNQAQQYMMDPAVDQHAAGQHGLDFRSYADFKSAVASGIDFTGYAGGINQWLINVGLDTVAKYGMGMAAAKLHQIIIACGVDLLAQRLGQRCRR